MNPPRGETTTNGHEPARARVLDELSRERFDVLVVGGGIAGVAIAREAAIRGWRAALVERGDFASGTSGRTSRLVHGGLRYLKQGHIGFVRKSIRAQITLARVAPRLVRPLNFLTPLYRDGPYPAGPMRVFMGAFRAVHGGLDRLPYENLDARACVAREPLLRSEGLVGGFCYREFLTHDARLVVETALAARERGTAVLNYVCAEELLVVDGRVAGARVRDRLTDAEVEIRARAVVNAAGPWAESFLDGRRALRLSKGVHLAVPRERAPITQPLVLFSPRDTRAVFAIPMARFVLIGTTETDHEASPDEARAEPADVAYLLETVNHSVPLALTPADVVAAWAAVRPLVEGRARDPGTLSRDHAIVRGTDGLVTVLGGKLTLHREVADEALAALAAPAARSPDVPLPGEVWPRARPALEAALAELVGEIAARHLVTTYGGRAAALLARIEADPDLGASIVPGLPHVRAELDHAAENEMTLFADDYALRRTDFAIEARVLGIDPAVALDGALPAASGTTAPRAEERAS